jgi:hypothetical protein
MTVHSVTIRTHLRQPMIWQKIGEEMIRRNYGILITGLCLLTLAAIGANAATSRTAQGTWKLNVAKSSYEQMQAPKYEKLVVQIDTSDALKWMMTGAAADGKSYVLTYDGPIDGQSHPYGNPEMGNTIIYTRTAAGVQWVVKDKAGSVVDSGTSHLSEDGNTLTLKGTAQQTTGKANYVSVFDRVQ